MITSTKPEVCDGEVCDTSLFAGQGVRPEGAMRDITGQWPCLIIDREKRYL